MTETPNHFKDPMKHQSAKNPNSVPAGMREHASQLGVRLTEAAGMAVPNRTKSVVKSLFGKRKQEPTAEQKLKLENQNNIIAATLLEHDEMPACGRCLRVYGMNPECPVCNPLLETES